nr:ABC transporter ATP-binding protein [Pseudofrankia saprophytica]
MDEDTNVITVTELWRRYGPVGRRGYDAVQGVEFSVRRGELFALLGTNGAGKTSTLEVLEGLARPSAGTVRVLGCDPFRDRRLVRPRIGIMLQAGAFPADLTVTEAAWAWAGTLTSPRPVAEALDIAGVRDRATVRIRQLSGGERRRLDLAMAILGRPEVLFLDEPTTGLDPESRRATWDGIGKLLAAGTTVVLTTHYLEEAEVLANHLAIMHRGRLVRTGTPAEVVASQPARISFELDAELPVELPELPGTRLHLAEAWLGRRKGKGKGGSGSGGGDGGGSDSGGGDGGGDGGGGGGGCAVLLTTADLQQTLAVLLAWGDRHGIRLHNLNARSASLEEAFLAVAQAEETLAGEFERPGRAVRSAQAARATRMRQPDRMSV